MTTKKLTRRQRILVATTLFGMFFGAGNLIFPVHLGQMAGSNVIPAIIGFIITAVGIPIFGVAAIGVTHSDGLQTLSGKVGKGYGIFFTCLLYLTIGPLFAIPRCATVSFTTGVSPMVSETAQPLALLLFSAVFFAFVLFFSLRPGKITVWIGKIINPVFLLFLAVLVIAALLKPARTFFAHSTFPSSGMSLPVTMFIKVDFPSPLAPTRPMCSPFRRRKDTSLKMARSPKPWVRCSTFKILISSPFSGSSRTIIYGKHCAVKH